MNQRPNTEELASYLQAYVALVPDGDVLLTLDRQGRHVEHVLSGVPAAAAESPYAPGKWTMKQVLQHLVDGERVFCYRALCIARGETGELPGFDENVYAAHDGSTKRSLRAILAEHAAVRAATLQLFAGFDADAWARRGKANGKSVGVRAIAWILAGHELHHLRVLEANYGVAGAATVAAVDDAPFGVQLYTELRREGLLSVLHYKEIQLLKRADRDGAAELFHEFPFAFRQRFASATPTEIVAGLREELGKRNTAMPWWYPLL